MVYICYRKIDLEIVSVSSSGLLISGEDEIVMNVVPNFGGQVEDYGFITIDDEVDKLREGNIYTIDVLNNEVRGISIIDSVRLTSDKQSILADGVDTTTLTAKLYKSTGETVSFYDEQGNLLDSVVETNGQAQLQVTSTMTGKIVVRTVSENYGEATIEIEVV